MFAKLKKFLFSAPKPRRSHRPALAERLNRNYTTLMAVRPDTEGRIAHRAALGDPAAVRMPRHQTLILPRKWYDDECPTQVIQAIREPEAPAGTRFTTSMLKGMENASPRRFERIFA